MKLPQGELSAHYGHNIKKCSCNALTSREIIPILHLTKAHKLQDHKQYPQC
jgi:hypothetical protein